MDDQDPAQTWRHPFEFEGWDSPALLDREVGRRTVRITALLAAAVGATFALIYAVIGPAAFVLPTAVASVALVVIAMVPSRFAQVQLYAGVTVGLLLLTVDLVLIGSVDNGITIWFLVPNLAALIIGARRVALYCTTVTMAAVTGVMVGDWLGWPMGDVALPHPELIMTLSMVMTLGVCGAIAHITLGARRQLMSEVEARNAALAIALDEARAARAEAVEASRAKDRFFANLTHEIRTPLTGIAGTAELLGHTALDADQRSLAGALAASTSNLTTLVNSMLDHARLQAGHVGIDPSPVEIRRAAESLEHLFHVQAADKGLELTVTVADDMPAWIEVDGIKLRQIVDNLVANAVKFTAHGSVAVAIGQAPPPAAGVAPRLVVRVSDTGPGISPQQAAAIFEPFVQGDASISRTHGGTGLGLAIARQLAVLLGGTLTVRSRQGEGSEFTLALPFRAAVAPEPAPARPGPTAAPAAGLRVLLAEDNAINRNVASAMLRRLDAVIHVVEDGAQAVAAAARDDFHLVLMDLQMPGMDGIEAAREIRRGEAASGRPPVPIVAMTGNAPEDYGDDCATAGMDGFLMKPVGLAALRELLEHVRAAAADGVLVEGVVAPLR